MTYLVLVYVATLVACDVLIIIVALNQVSGVFTFDVTRVSAHANSAANVSRRGLGNYDEYKQIFNIAGITIII